MPARKTTKTGATEKKIKAKEMPILLRASSNSMINTITLSTDMETLYLIDNGRAIAFSLSNTNGIIIASVKGQVTAVTAPDIPQEDPTPDGSSSTAKTSLTKSEKASGSPAPPEKVMLPIPQNQWTIFFNPKNEYLCVIGATDIDVARNPELDVKPQILFFRLRESIVTIRRVGTNLELIPTKLV